jgi:ATP-dependent helicase HrpB
MAASAARRGSTRDRAVAAGDVRISKAAAEQRAGRAGRTAPGVAIRLWTEALHRGLPLPTGRRSWRRAVGPGARLRRLGRRPGDARLPRPAARRRAGRGARAAARPGCAGRRRAHHPDGAAHGADGHASAPRAHDAGRADEGEKALAADLAALLEERDPIRDREAPSDITLRLDLLHGGDRRADRGTIQRIRRAAALHRRRLRLHGTRCRAAMPARCSPPASPTGSRRSAARWTAPSAWPPARARGCRPPTRWPRRRCWRWRTWNCRAPRRASAWPRRSTARRAGARFPDRLRREEGAAFDARAGAVLARRA